MKKYLLRGSCKTTVPQKIDDFDASFQGQQAGPSRADETMPEWAGEEARRKLAPKGRFYGAHEFCKCLLSFVLLQISLLAQEECLSEYRFDGKKVVLTEK